MSHQERSVSQPERHLKPVLIIGYGERGAHWLNTTLARLLQYPTLQRMVASRLLQVWHVADQRLPMVAKDITTVAPSMGAAKLRALLDDGRTVANRASFPGLGLETMLVLERWSLFDPAVDRRLEFQEGMDLANRVNCDPSQPHAFFYTWVSLADCIREAASLSDEMKERARSIIKTAGVEERIFLIDRVDADQAVIPASMADQVYAELTRALLTSDLAFPRAGQHVTATLDGEPSDHEVIPFTIQVFEHGTSDVATARGQHLGRQILDGPRQVDLFPPSKDIPSLASLVVEEQRELREGRFDPRMARQRRQTSATELIRQALLTKDRDRSLSHSVYQVSRDARAFCAPDNLEHTSMAALALLGMPELGVIATLLAGGAVAFYWWRWKRPSTTGSEPAPVVPTGDPGTAALLCEEWGRLCGSLQAFLETLPRLNGLFAPGSGAWDQHPENPYLWRLSGDPAVQVEVSSPDRSSLEGVAHHCLTLLLEQASDDGPADTVTRALILYGASELANSRDLSTTLVRAAFQGRTSRHIEQFIRSASMMVSAPSVKVAEVIWLVGPSSEATEVLIELEPPEHKRLTRVLHQDDEGLTTRLCFGSPVRWDEVLSLQGVMQR